MPDFTELLAKLEDPDTGDYRQEAAQAIRELQAEVKRLGALPTLTTKRGGKTLTATEWHARELHHFEAEIELNALRRRLALVRTILDRPMQFGGSILVYSYFDMAFRDIRLAVADDSRQRVLDEALDLEAARRGGIFEQLSNARKSRALAAEGYAEGVRVALGQQRLRLLDLVHGLDERRTRVGYSIAELKRLVYPIADELNRLQDPGYVADQRAQAAAWEVGS